MYSFPVDKAYKYDFSAPKFQTAFAFLRRDDLASLPVGWVELENGVRASVQRYCTAPAEGKRFETHEKYFDVQYLVSGMEKLGVCARCDLPASDPYQADNDIQFYAEPKCAGSVLLHAGDFVIFAPEDAHKPGCIAGEAMDVQKIVVKVPVD